MREAVAEERSKNMIMLKAGKNNQVQAIRGICCLMIMIYHYTCRYSSLFNAEQFYVSAFSKFTLIALCVFFCLSGFYAINQKPSTAAVYFIGKVRRLYPEYIIAIVIIYIFQLSGYLGAGREITFIQFLLNIPFLNIIFKTGFVDGAHWYVAFLLLIFFLLSLIKNTKIFQSSLICLLNSCFILVAGTALCILKINFAASLKNYLDYYLYFSIGIIYCRFMHYKIKKEHMFLALAIDILYVLLTKTILDCIYLCVACVSVYFALNKKVNFLERLKPFVIIGNNSYLIYLLHQNIGYIVINYTRTNFNFNWVMSVLCAVIIALIISFAVSNIRNIVFEFVRSETH